MITIDKNTPRECEYCGDAYTNASGGDELMCDPCMAAAELENAHEDGDHDDHGYADPRCRSCNHGVLSAAQRNGDRMDPSERAAAHGDWLRDQRKDEDDR